MSNNINNTTTLEQVKEFMVAFGQEIKDKPDLSSEKLCLFRNDLLEEELKEFFDNCVMDESKVHTLDALIDLQIVLDGAFLALGFHKIKNQAFDIVHKSNMAKMGPGGKPIVREDGKIMKPPGWIPPTNQLQELIDKLESGLIQ